jgi:flagellin
MSSILTNTSAMVALQTMKGITSNLNKTQSDISTGKSVASAKDNAAVWAISKVMESDVQGFKGISDSLAVGNATLTVARQASESVTKLLTDMKGKIVAAQAQNVDRAKLQTDVAELSAQITSVVGAAQFNGLNLLSGDPAGTTAPVNMQVLSSLDRDTAGAVTASNITVTAQDLRTTTGGGLAALGTLDVSTAGGATTALADIETMLQTSIDAAAAFGSSQKRIEIQSEFVSSLTDALKTGIGALVDTDMEEASARLQALQVQQQLATQALSIANQQPQGLLSLFR